MTRERPFAEPALAVLPFVNLNRDPEKCLFRELEQLRARGQAPPTAFAVIHAGLGEIDAAFEWLETAYRFRDGSLFWLAGAPGLDPLHADARFDDLLRRVGVGPL